MTGAGAGTGLRVGLLAGLRVGQAYGVFYSTYLYLPGFGLAVPVPWLLGTQPPFATWVLMPYLEYYSTDHGTPYVN